MRVMDSHALRTSPHWHRTPGQRDRQRDIVKYSLSGINSDYSVILTFVCAFDECLIDVLLPAVFQDVEETQVDRERLFQDDVQQRLSGFDWTISQRLDGVEVFDRQRVTFIHTHSCDMCVQFRRQVAVLRTHHVYTFNMYSNSYKLAVASRCNIHLFN